MFYGLKVAKDVIGSFQLTYEISKTLSNLAQKDENTKIWRFLIINKLHLSKLCTPLKSKKVYKACEKTEKKVVWIFPGGG